MKLRSKVMLCLLSSMSVQVHSQEQGELDSSAVAEAESQFLFINMLEFLGEFETENGEWISPDILGNEAFTDLDVQNNRSTTTESRREQSVLSASDENE